MRPIELAAECQRALDQGLSNLVLTQPPPKKVYSYGLGRTVRTPFGMGKVISIARDGNVIFQIEIEKVKKYLKKILAPSSAETKEKE